jgi:adenylate cyclase
MGVSATTAGRLRGAGAPSSRRAVAERVERRVTTNLLFAHALGVADVVLLLVLVLPFPPGEDYHAMVGRTALACAVYLPLSFAVGVHYGRRLGAARMTWVLEERDPTPEERGRLLRIPLRCFRMDAALWLGAAAVLAAVNLPAAPAVAVHLAWTIVLGGVTVCAIGHLLIEKELRPIVELALSSGPPARRAWPGVQGRLVLAWVLATGSPLLGIITVGWDALQHDQPPHEVALSVFVLGVVAFVTGLGVMLVVARSVSSPLTAVRKALRRVQAGDLDTGVRVDDGSEVGMLQSGFNSMVMGLRDRERVRDLYARHVGEDVAREALSAEPRLGGEVCDVAVLFVDLVGSTTLAAREPPERVVARLNAFFAVVVDVVARHGGWVNKFQGDAALCVFGAPVAQSDAAGCALSAGRELRARLRRELTWAEAGIGLSAGPVVAGWVGAVERFEYTVIGDPVNEASRLCELAKRRPERLLASGAIVARADEDERARWALGDAVTLRGRATPTQVAIAA